MKKLTKLLDKSDNNEGNIKIFTLLFENLIYFNISTEKASINPIY